MQTALQLTELFQTEKDAVIYTVLKKVKEFYNKKRPSKGWSGVHVLHDNASSHKFEVVFLASEKVKVLNHPLYSPAMSPCDFFFFSKICDYLRVERANFSAFRAFVRFVLV